MADEQITSNGNVAVFLVLANGIADYKAPTAAEINAGLNITNAIAWEGTTFPTATDSDDVDDRSLLDKGNATSRGAAQFEATLALFLPKDNKDTLSTYGKAYNALRVPRVPVYLITRVLQQTTGQEDPAKAGDWVSVYRFLSDGWTDDVEGDTAVKYTVGFLTQGDVAVYTQVKNSTPITVARAGSTGALAVGAHAVLRATMGGKPATQTVKWQSSSPSVATVSQNGVVTAVSSGSANITATHPAAAASTAVAITVS